MMLQDFLIIIFITVIAVGVFCFCWINDSYIQHTRLIKQLKTRIPQEQYDWILALQAMGMTYLRRLEDPNPFSQQYQLMAGGMIYTHWVRCQPATNIPIRWEWLCDSQWENILKNPSTDHLAMYRLMFI